MNPPTTAIGDSPPPLPAEPKPAPAARAGAWSAHDAETLYALSHWGDRYFTVTERGTLAVRPDRNGGRQIDLHEIVRGLADREIATPVLIRFTDLMRDRMARLRGAFDEAMREADYAGGYTCVYPIKVNQQRAVLEEVRAFSTELGFGLEAGSKPELLAVLGLTEGSGLADPGLPIVCNGFKDEEYLETCVLAHKLGRDITPIIERDTELTMLLALSERYGVAPPFGVRIKPTARGAGRWAESGGMRSKFGLHASQLVAAVEMLRGRGMLDRLRLIHFHVGSQICDIRQLKSAVTELAHIYAELRRMGADGLDTIDIGGGLGIDYDGSGAARAGSMNYTIEEYAADVVHRVKAVCDEAGTPHPRIMSESGRAISAYSSVLITDVLGAGSFDADPADPEVRATIDDERERGQQIPQPVLDLVDAADRAADPGTSIDDAYELYHDTITARDEAISLFNLGFLSLPLRACCERLFWSVGGRLIDLAKRDDDLAEALGDLPDLLSDIYYCNFSLFQSLPDSWAIDQVFPIVPIHRLDEKPTRRAVLADITCDSDGQVSRFASDAASVEYQAALPVHALTPRADDPETNEPYYLGIFLVGAYQEVLGDLHNLFGDTHAVHVTLDDDGHVSIDEFVEGDTVNEVLGYVQFDTEKLRTAMRRDIERATKQGRMSVPEGRSLMRFYDDGLRGYTYLE